MSLREKFYFCVLGFVFCLFQVTGFYYCLDREMAKDDYLNCKEAEHCIFQSNCDYYNNLEMTHKCKIKLED